MPRVKFDWLLFFDENRQKLHEIAAARGLQIRMDPKNKQIQISVPDDKLRDFLQALDETKIRFVNAPVCDNDGQATIIEDHFGPGCHCVVEASMLEEWEMSEPQRPAYSRRKHLVKLASDFDVDVDSITGGDGGRYLAILQIGENVEAKLFEFATLAAGWYYDIAKRGEDFSLRFFDLSEGIEMKYTIKQVVCFDLGMVVPPSKERV